MNDDVWDAACLESREMALSSVLKNFEDIVLLLYQRGDPWDHFHYAIDQLRIDLSKII